MFRVLILVGLLSSEAFAHPGRTDKKGGHKGPSGYHYHGASESDSAAPALQYAQITEQESRSSRSYEPRTIARTESRLTARTTAPSTASNDPNTNPQFQFEIVRKGMVGNTFTAFIRVAFNVLTKSLEDFLATIPRRLTDKPNFTIFVIHENDNDDAKPILRLRVVGGRFSVEQMPRYNAFIAHPPKKSDRKPSKPSIENSELVQQKTAPVQTQSVPIGWFYKADGIEKGPMSATELFSLCDQNIITEQSEVRRSEGEYSKWTSAEKVDGMLFPPVAPSAVFVRDLDREAMEEL